MDRSAENVYLTLRVAARFAARPLKPEKMTELLMKLRKGSATSLKGVELVQVLNHLGDWIIDEHHVLVSDAGPYAKDEKQLYFNAHPGNVKSQWDNAKAHEVKHLPDPTHLKLYEKVYMDVSPIEPLARDPNQTSFTYRGWQVRLGVRVISPEHKTWEKPISVDQFLMDYPSNNGLMKWLRTETSFLDQINAKLGTSSYEAEKAQSKAPTLTRSNTGTCPCCFRNIKLTPRTKKGRDKSMPGMVVHGYKRPGNGSIHSNCFGEDWPPFEFSKEGTLAWMEKLEEALTRNKAVLHNLESGKTTRIFDINRKEFVQLGDPSWDRFFDLEVSGVKDTIESIGMELSRSRRYSSAWKPQPLPEEGREVVEASY